MKIEIRPSNEFVFCDGIVARIWRGTTDRGTKCIVVVTRIGTADDSPEDEFRELLDMQRTCSVMTHAIEEITLEDPSEAN